MAPNRAGAIRGGDLCQAKWSQNGADVLFKPCQVLNKKKISGHVRFYVHFIGCKPPHLHHYRSSIVALTHYLLFLLQPNLGRKFNIFSDDKRLDQWIDGSDLRLNCDTKYQIELPKKRSKLPVGRPKNMKKENGIDSALMDDKLEKQHQNTTRIRNIQSIQIGQYDIKTVSLQFTMQSIS
jgi:hypothetical protein